MNMYLMETQDPFIKFGKKSFESVEKLLIFRSLKNYWLLKKNKLSNFNYGIYGKEFGFNCEKDFINSLNKTGIIKTDPQDVEYADIPNGGGRTFQISVAKDLENEYLNLIGEFEVDGNQYFLEKQLEYVKRFLKDRREEFGKNVIYCDYENFEQFNTKVVGYINLFYVLLLMEREGEISVLSIEQKTFNVPFKGRLRGISYPSFKIELHQKILTAKPLNKNGDKGLVKVEWEKFKNTDIEIEKNTFDFKINDKVSKFSGLKPDDKKSVITIYILAKRQVGFANNQDFIKDYNEAKSGRLSGKATKKSMMTILSRARTFLKNINSKGVITSLDKIGFIRLLGE